MPDLPEGVEVRGYEVERQEEVLTKDALAFVAKLHREFNPERTKLLEARAERQKRFDAGELPDFLSDTKNVRDGDWRVAEVPHDLQDRKVEITGPTDRKMVINALNSGASTYMADFEDANTPSWRNLVSGQVNVIDAIEGTIELTTDDKTYRLDDDVATLIVRPRGWHLPEKHIVVDGEQVSGSLFDFGLFFFHNARRLLDKGSGPYFYLPKLESHTEARLWNEAFNFAQDELGIERGTIKATVLVEVITLAFEMEEVLYELRDHSAGLNAGRWDYIFSAIKKFRRREDFVLPDRNKVTMTVPFMRAYTELLVKTCHKRGAFAVGGMAAFIPSRRRPEINETAIAKVQDDKQREANDGFDGTWVAHPDLVGVAKSEFDKILGDGLNQLERRRDEVSVTAKDLLNIPATPGDVTEEGVRSNVNVGIQYISSWLRGNGAASIYNLMEDAATCEIARSQVWQWVRNRARLAEGREITEDLIRRLESEELERIRGEIGDDDWFYNQGQPEKSRGIFEQVALSDDFIEFLTLPAYEHID